MVLQYKQMEYNIKIMYIVGILALTFFLTAGECIFQIDRYWVNIWKSVGNLDVKNIKELKDYINKGF